MYIDLHNHLVDWSPDASQSWEDLVSAAKDAKLLGFGISDHYDIGSYTAEGREWIFDVDAYLEKFKPYRTSVQDVKSGKADLAFALGIEVGYLPLEKKRLRQLMAHDFDYFIVSVHKVRGMDPYEEKEEVYGKGLNYAYSTYLQTILEAVQELPKAAILAHFDYISRYAPQNESKLYFKGLEGEFEALFQKIIEDGIALEINTGTIGALIAKGYDLENALPDRQIIERYLDMGGEYFTLTTDSHHVGHRGRFITEALKYLSSFGVEKLAYFENQKLATASFI